MRALINLLTTTCLFACGLCSCTQDATPPPATPDTPGTPPMSEPDAPGPPRDMPETAEVGEDGVLRGVGSILAQQRLDGPMPASVRVEVELFDDQGDRLGGLEQTVNPTRQRYALGFGHTSWDLAEGEWLVQAWWPGDWPATHATLRVLDGPTVLQADELEIKAVPIADTECDPLGFANRCAEGLICHVLPRPVVGTCVPADINVWRTADGPTLEIVADPLSSAVNTVLFTLDAMGAPQALAESLQFWRSLYRVDPTGDAFALYLGAHRQMVPVREPEIRNAEQPCDGDQIANVCAGELRCNVDAVCRLSTPPMITAAGYNWGRIWAAANILGHDPEGDLEAIEFSDGERVETWNIRTWRYGVQSAERNNADPKWHVGLEQHANGDFELIWALESNSGTFMRQVDIVLIDREGNRSPPFAAVGGHIGERNGNTFLPEGALCDVNQSGFLGSCVDRRCGLIDGESNYRCLPPAEACPYDLEPINGARLEATTMPDESRPDEHDAWLPCSPLNSTWDRGFVLTTEEAGLQVIRARGDGVIAVSLRSACDRVTSDQPSTCVGAEMPAADATLETQMWMDAGQQIYVIVETAFPTAFTLEMGVD